MACGTTVGRSRRAGHGQPGTMRTLVALGTCLMPHTVPGGPRASCCSTRPRTQPASRAAHRTRRSRDRWPIGRRASCCGGRAERRGRAAGHPPRSGARLSARLTARTRWEARLHRRGHVRCRRLLPDRTGNAAPGPVYLVDGLDRGDHMANWSPDEALPAIAAGQRTPLTLSEGIHWLLQQPEALERGHCFMTIGSRLRRPNGLLDARPPALWITTAPDAMAETTATHQNSDGAGPATGTPG